MAFAIDTSSLQYKKGHILRFGRSALAALLVGMVMLLNAMAASPALHELIHKDASKANHDCAVTMFALGKVDSATVEISASPQPVSIETNPQIVISVFASAIENLPAGRAPPASVSPLV
jgi:hypothetical protein